MFLLQTSVKYLDTFQINHASSKVGSSVMEALLSLLNFLCFEMEDAFGTQCQNFQAHCPGCEP